MLLFIKLSASSKSQTIETDKLSIKVDIFRVCRVDFLELKWVYRHAVVADNNS